MATTRTSKFNHRQQRGYTLIEALICIVIITVVAGAILSQMNDAQQHASTEQSKLDDFQEARDFVDQFFRDISQLGYPNSRMIDASSTLWIPILASQLSPIQPLMNDSRVAAGLVKVDANELRFEGDTNGDGAVESIVYMVNGSGNCALCLQRSQKDKTAPYSDPLTGQGLPNWGTEVNDVLLCSAPCGGPGNKAIFSYYKADGTQVLGPLDISSPAGAQAIASIKTIQISLSIRNKNVTDAKTKEPIQIDFEGEASLNNCSMAATGQPMSCR